MSFELEKQLRKKELDLEIILEMDECIVVLNYKILCIKKRGNKNEQK